MIIGTVKGIDIELVDCDGKIYYQLWDSETGDEIRSDIFFETLDDVIKFFID